MKDKATKPLTSKQVKARNKYDMVSVSSVVQPSQKKASSKNTQIDTSQYIKFNANKLADIIKQIESVMDGLKILALEIK